MTYFQRMLRHLLPKSILFRLANGARMQQLFDGVIGALETFDAYLYNIWGDGLPATTRDLERWESQFGLLPRALSTADRRDAVAAAWRAATGQSPYRIQTALQAAGFDVYVHEWWSAVGPPPTVRDPRIYIDNAISAETCQMGEAVAEMGEALAVMGEVWVRYGHLIVNDYDAAAALTIPEDPDTWRHFWYIGGATFPNTANVDVDRQEEFISMVLKLKPAHTWVGVLVLFV